MNPSVFDKTLWAEKSTTFASLIIMIALCLGLAGHSHAMSGMNADVCLDQTVDEPQCKDCCDCLAEADQRQACRDACMVHDFSANSVFISFTAPSTRGPGGDYSDALGFGNERDCKAYCDQSDVLDCGDRRYCRDACMAAFSDQQPPAPNPDEPPPSPHDTPISLEQAISDEAQLKTIAFDGLAFLTGDMCSDTFFPPGKVSDFFGFQYLRDITPNGYGHNTEFAGRIADSMLAILSDAQVRSLVALANAQADQIDAYGYQRFVLIKAFRRLLSNDLPAGATGLSKRAVSAFSADLYEIDGQISYDRAAVLGAIIATLSDAQNSQILQLQQDLATLFEQAGAGGTIDPEDWPQADPVDLTGLENKARRVLVSTYATQLYSWYLGSIEGDTYFCPERHGTYFGSFYLKDIPPISAPEAVTIDEGTTARLGAAFLETLDSSQQAWITGIVDEQRSALLGIVATRREIAETLRRLMVTDNAGVRDQVLTLARRYGEYDGELVYQYATRFASVADALSDGQAAALTGLRRGYYEQFPQYAADPHAYDCAGAWLYADPVDMPTIMNTDFLFDSEPPDDEYSDCLTFTENMDLFIPCAAFNGQQFAFNLVFRPLSGDISWQLDPRTLQVTSHDEHCLSFADNLDLMIDCAKTSHHAYAFMLNFRPDPLSLVWQLDEASVTGR